MSFSESSPKSSFLHILLRHFSKCLGPLYTRPFSIYCEDNTLVNLCVAWRKKKSLLQVALILLLNNVYLELYASNVVPVDTAVYFGWFFLLNNITLTTWAMLKVVYEWDLRMWQWFYFFFILSFFVPTSRYLCGEGCGVYNLIFRCGNSRRNLGREVSHDCCAIVYVPGKSF